MHKPSRVGQYVEESLHLLQDFAIFLGQPFLLETGEPLQAHVENFLGLYRREQVTLVTKPVPRVEVLGT